MDKDAGYAHTHTHTHTHTMHYCLATEKNEILPFATMWMDQETIVLSEVSQTKTEKYYMFSCPCGI